VAGYGKAARPRCRRWSSACCKLPGLPGSDAADALGLAITHAHIGPGMQRLAAVTDLSRKTSAMFKHGRNY
jgi:crossover junction endodeoxyribonuclease RuvC